MRKVFFRVLLLILAFLAVVFVIAAKTDRSPKAVLQGWFQKNDTTMSGEIINSIPIETNSNSALSGELSEQDKTDTENFLNSIGQQ